MVCTARFENVGRYGMVCALCLEYTVNTRDPQYSFITLRRWWSGQSQQTVNLSTSVFAGSNPARRTNKNNPNLRVYFRRAGLELDTQQEYSLQ